MDKIELIKGLFDKVFEKSKGVFEIEKQLLDCLTNFMKVLLLVRRVLEVVGLM